MIDGQNFFDQPVKNDLRTYANIQKIACFTRTFFIIEKAKKATLNFSQRNCESIVNLFYFIRISV